MAKAGGKSAPGSGRRLAVLALLVTMTVGGSTFVVTKAVLDEAGPFAVAVLRFGVGLGVLLPFAYRRGCRFWLGHPARDVGFRRGAVRGAEDHQ